MLGLCLNSSSDLGPSYRNSMLKTCNAKTVRLFRSSVPEARHLSLNALKVRSLYAKLWKGNIALKGWCNDS